MRRRFPLFVSLALAVVRLVAFVVPGRDRASWRREWESEILHRHLTLEREHRSTWKEQMPLTRRALGSILDAAWIRRQFTRDSELVHDLRHIRRIAWRSPATISLVVAILAIGIGTTTSVFSVVEAIFLRPLPYADASRIVMIWQRSQKAADVNAEVAPANFVDWRAQLASGFEIVAAVVPYSRDYTGGGEPEIFLDAQVTEGFFDVLRVEPQFGRLLTPDDYRLRRNVVVLSDGIWKRRFGGDPTVVGQQVRLDGQPFEIVGILPPSFQPRI